VLPHFEKATQIKTDYPAAIMYEFVSITSYKNRKHALHLLNKST
jgi:hypothetical protein